MVNTSKCSKLAHDSIFQSFFKLFPFFFFSQVKTTILIDIKEFKFDTIDKSTNTRKQMLKIRVDSKTNSPDFLYCVVQFSKRFSTRPLFSNAVSSDVPLSNAYFSITVGWNERISSGNERTRRESPF